MTTVAILTIGTEITRGEIVNTNASWLADQLSSTGAEVVSIEAIPDDIDQIGSTLLRLASSADLLVSSGGLGPTTDDLTSAAVARALKVDLVRDPQSLQTIHAWFASRGRSASLSNEKQADFPEGATVLPNLIGTAPGFSVTIGPSAAFFFPGVPREMRALFTAHVLPFLATKSTGSIADTRLRVFGLPESMVNDKLAGIEEQHKVTIGYRATFPEVEVKVLASAPTADAARSRAHEALLTIKERLEDEVIVAEGESSLPTAVVHLLLERRLRLAAAESCTGGLLGALVTETPGSSQCFVGSIVAYDNDVKARVLEVPEEILRTHGAVSEATAIALAEGSLKLLPGADLAVSVTGIAGPGGGTPDKPVGLVHLALAARDGALLTQKIYGFGERDRVRRLAAFVALDMVRRHVLGFPPLETFFSKPPTAS